MLSGLAALKAAGAVPPWRPASNEVAVEAFLAGRIAFGRISEVIEGTLKRHTPAPADSLEAVRAADAEARSQAERLLG